MAPSCLDKQTADWKSSHDWLVTLGIDLVTFCDMWSSEEPKLMPFGCVQLTRGACHLVAAPPPPTLHPYRSACGIEKASKKWQAIQLVIYPRVDTLKDLE